MILLRASAIFLLALASLVPARGDAPQSASKAKPESAQGHHEGEPGGREQAGQLHERRGPDPGPELHRLPQPQEVGEQVRMTTFAQLAKGGQQGEGITLEPGDPDESYLRRADPPRRLAPDALQAGPAAPGEGRDSSSAGSRRGPSTTARQLDRGLDGRASQEHPGRDSRVVPRGRPDHGPGVQP